MKLLFLGDFLYDYEFYQDDISSIIDWINEKNLKVILNLEGPLGNKGRHIKKRGKLLRQSEVTIDLLKKLNVIGVCLANNHMMDFGAEALYETIKILSDNGIQYTGAGVNIHEALTPMMFNFDNQLVIVQNFGWDIEETVYATSSLPGCAPRSEQIILKNTKDLREKFPNSKIINVFHWGFELNYLPMPFDVKLAHETIDSGCDLIIGHHPHNIQPYEKYKDKHIFYSLGNFYFSSMRDKFHVKKFRHQIPNLCDYGAMVIYDLLKDNINIKHCVFYNYDKKMSEIIPSPKEILQDYTKYDFFGDNYLQKAKESSININPILTLDIAENRRKLLKLKGIYIISSVFRSIRKTKLGNKVYTEVKNKLLSK